MTAFTALVCHLWAASAAAASTACDAVNGGQFNVSAGLGGASGSLSPFAAGERLDFSLTIGNGFWTMGAGPTYLEATTSGPQSYTVTGAGDTSVTYVLSNASMTVTCAAGPTASGLTPDSGSYAGGTSISITGAYFVAPVSVSFGGVAAPSVTVDSSTQITAIAPVHSGGSLPDTVQVVVTTPEGSSAPLSYTYTDGPPVQADDAYQTDQGQVLTVPAPGVLANDTDPDGGPLAIESHGTPGNGTLSLTSTGPGAGAFTYTPNAGFSGEDSFTYRATDGSGISGEATVKITVVPVAPTVSGIAPGSGALAGGTDVTLTGTLFTGASSVTFGGVAATSFSVVSDTQIDAVSPAGSVAGPVDVVVTTVGGTSLPASFTYLAPGMLAVEDAGGLASAGTVGGPFSPASKSWDLRNDGDEAIDVTVTATGTFFDLAGATSGTPFQLGAGATRTITATINASANALGAGQATGTIAIVNQTNGSGTTSRDIVLDVAMIATALSLSSSSNPVVEGEQVTFTATLSGGTSATGSVEFFDGATSLGSSVLTGGTATFSTTSLAAGTRAISATYSGDTNHAGATADLSQTVTGLGAVVLVQQATGPDASFGFTSPTPALNLSIVTSGGIGQTGTVQLPAGSYQVTATDMSSAGFALVGLSCSDTDSSGDVAGRTAFIDLSGGETVTCTFVAASSSESTQDTIDSFMRARGGVILANQPDIQRRIDRLNRQVSALGNPVVALMSYVPGISKGRGASIAASLGQLDRLAGNQEPDRFDVWLQGTFGRYEFEGADGDFALAAIGADYLVSPDILVGAFVQVDTLSQSDSDDVSAKGTGWLAGPYLTARLGDHLYLDLLAAAGRSGNQIRPMGTYQDDFSSTRFLASAALQGEWTREAWTFSPRARLSWYSEASDAYVDRLGVAIPEVTVDLGQIAVGPGISYRFETQGAATIETGLRFEGLADYVSGTGLDWQGRVEGRVEATFANALSLELSVAHDGIGSGGLAATSGRARISMPLN